MKLLKNPITYKILVDIFFIMLIMALGFITIETILPGILSAYISPMILFAIIFIIVITTSFIARTQKIYTSIVPHKKYFLILFTILFAILITISSLGYKYLFGSLVVILSITTFLLLNSLLQNILHNDLKK